jgi:cytochrome b subunit of formate dehydrogenase
MITETTYYPRFRIGARIEHFILMVSFTILAITGLPQKYASNTLSQNLIALMGGIETTRLIHHAAAGVLVAGSFYHLFTSAYRIFVKHERMRILPELQDARDLVNTVRYNLGLLEEAPNMAKFNFGEKFEYWAVVWGTAVMAITGLVLWNPIAFAATLPGEFIPAAKAAHGGEAVLAVLSIIVWHMYSVHFKHFNPSIFTGKLSRHQMEDEHAGELARLDAGGTPWPQLDLPVLQRRRRTFILISAVAGSLILIGLLWLLTFEETAITTVPRATREIFVPLVTPVP